MKQLKREFENAHGAISGALYSTKITRFRGRFILLHENNTQRNETCGGNISSNNSATNESSRAEKIPKFLRNEFSISY